MVVSHCNLVGDVINFLQFIIKNLVFPSIETSKVGNYSQMKATENMQKLFMVHHNFYLKICFVYTTFHV